MGTSRQITETQLEKAKAALAVRVAALKAQGVEAKSFKRDPKWRELDGKVRQINARLGKVGELVAKNELGESILGSPAVVDGALYIRSDAHLFKVAQP